jgi:hypothetical protein
MSDGVAIAWFLAALALVIAVMAYYSGPGLMP